MLIITRRPGEKIMLGDDVVVEVIEVSGSSVRIGIAAPKSIPVYREEIWAAVQAENRAAAASHVDHSQRRPDAHQEVLAHSAASSLSAPSLQGTKDHEMSLTITHNIEAMNAHADSSSNTDKLSEVDGAALSSGYRINRAADDAAGLGISESHARADPRPRAGEPQHPGRHLDGPDRRRQPRRGPLDAAAHPRARRAVQERLAATTTTAPRSRPRSTSSRPRSTASAPRPQFNGINAPDDGSATVSFQVGANDGRADRVSRSEPRRLGRHGRTRAVDAATTPISEIDAAIDAVSAAALDVRRGAEPPRAHADGARRLPGEPGLGRVAHPRRRHGRGDDDLTKMQVLQQAGTSMLAQANQLPQSVLAPR